MSPAPKEVDVIVVGGGAAGCIVAGRLAKADPNLEVAIIEFGINNKDYPTSIQPAMYLSHIAPNSTTAHFHVGKKSDALGGRESIVPSGGMLGGGSSINFMMYTRASASDYDDWEAAGNKGWGFKDILPLARKAETCTIQKGYDPELHGTSGPLSVSYGGHQSEIGRQFIKATAESYPGMPYQADIQDFKTGHAVTNWAKWIDPKTGRRQDTAHGYVHPVLESQSNLHLYTEKKVIRVLFEGKKAVGVEYCDNNAEGASNVETIRARKLVVVSAGALSTPPILERSGLGSKEVLEKAGVDVVVDLPGVGKDYQDHQLTLATYHVDDNEDTLDDYLRGVPEVHGKVGPEWQESGQGLVATNVIDAGFKARPTEEEVAGMGEAFQEKWNSELKAATDKPIMFGGMVSSFLGDHSVLPPGKYTMAGSFLMYPYSKGHVHITSKDPFAPTDFNAAFLDHPADMEPQVWMYKRLREVIRRMPTYRGEVAALHPKFKDTSNARAGKAEMPAAPLQALSQPNTGAQTTPDSAANDKSGEIKDIEYTEEDNEAIREWLRANVQTTWHSMATCQMRPREQDGVVDPRLNVYGTENLKLADLSICPSNMGSNTYSVAIMVGEKAAVLIGEDLGIKNV